MRFVIARDRHGIMRFAPLEGEFAADVLARHPELEGVDSLVLVERVGQPDERVYVRSEAVLRIADHMGGAWRAARWLMLVPRPLRDFVYNIVSRVRYRVFGRFDSCPVPPASVRARFLP